MDKRANILLVDDKSQNLDVLESILDSPVYRLIRAHNANRALEAILAHDIAAVVLDVEMPEMSGLELARIIKSRKKTQHIPILFLSAQFREDQDVLEGYGAGAVDYLTKPVNAQILTSKVAVFADLFRKTQALAAANQALEVEITVRKQAEERIAAALREKETLLKEVHYRVKNNLQVISSLLDLQAGQTQDAAVRAVLAESQGRVRVMALIHQLLYERKDFSRVDLGRYLERLTQIVLSVYPVDPHRIALKLAAAEVYVDLERAMPCALLVNELVTNALKHAFPGGRAGEIGLTLKTHGDREAVLTHRDNGVGLPAGLDINQATSLGLQLVPLFVDQMHGSLRVERGPGACFEVRFPTGEG
ncbi:MAG: sensor histidine kinase [Candidatus Methylomirabilaceae bacterium]